jgi:hypothetical protein
MKKEYHISKCCKADIFFKGIGEGLWCSKCKKEIWETIVAFTDKEILELKRIRDEHNPPLKYKKLLTQLSNELYELISKEDLTDEDLREASENLLPSLCDVLYDCGYGKRIMEDLINWNI